MHRYIDIDVALYELEHTPFYDKRDYETTKEMIKTMPTMPTADVVEVRRGRWLNKGRKTCCSVCGSVNFLAPNFCPECGADMRERREDVRKSN